MVSNGKTKGLRTPPISLHFFNGMGLRLGNGTIRGRPLIKDGFINSE